MSLAPLRERLTMASLTRDVHVNGTRNVLDACLKQA